MAEHHIAMFAILFKMNTTTGSVIDAAKNSS